jgi:hypothetical protein
VHSAWSPYAVLDFWVKATQVSVSLCGLAYAADAFLDCDHDTYELLETRNRFVAVLNDLHKGRDSGYGWSVMIGASAILLTLVSLSGAGIAVFDA